MTSDRWRDYLLTNHGLNLLNGFRVTPPPELPTRAPLQDDNGSPTGVSKAVERLTECLREIGASSSVVETAARDLPYAVGEAEYYRQAILKQPTRKDLLSTFQGLEKSARETAQKIRELEPVALDYLRESSDQDLMADLAQMQAWLERLTPAAARCQTLVDESKKESRRNPGRLELYVIEFFLAECWIAAHDGDTSTIHRDNDRNQSKFVDFAFDIIKCIDPQIQRQSVSAAARPVTKALRDTA